MSTTPALFAGLLDDAAMFPPGNATPSDALRAHLGHRIGAGKGLVGPLLIPAARFEEFCAAWVDVGSPPVAVSLVGAAEVPDQVPPAIDVVGFELPVDVPPLPDPGGAYRVACEVTSSSNRVQVLAAVAEGRARGRQVIAKYRTGGTTAEAFPTGRALAEVLLEAAAVRAPLKFTAGLHSAIRFTDPATGFDHHGFLNLMTAVSAAVSGAEEAVVESALAQRDSAAVTAEVNSWTAAEIADVRAAFVSFGCCGVEEPIADLVKLGLLDTDSL